MIRLQDSDFTLHVGDVREVLAELPAESVHCVVTSPPYWGLRDYGTGSWDGGDPDCDHKAPPTGGPNPERYTPGGGEMFRAANDKLFQGACGKCGAQRVDRQLGLEPTPQEYVANMVAVFRQVRRVLRDDGTLWLNLGSSYFSEPAKGGSGPGGKNEARWSYGRASRGTQTSPSRPDAPAYGTDGTAPSGSPGLDSAYPDLCDGCLDDFRSHLLRTTDTPQPLGQDALRPEQTDRGNAPPGSVSASPVASPPAVQASTTLESWLRLRGSCSRCDSRASSLSDVRSSASDAPASSHMPWLNYTRRLKPKDMVPTPWMVAMALQQDGWYLRADIVWSKANPMPESVTDRPTKAHEYLFLLTKSPRYFFDQEAVREPVHPDSFRSERVNAGQMAREHLGKFGATRPVGRTCGVHESGGRNVRSVWEIATQPYPDAHFATFPEELPRRCIAAGCPEGGVVLDPFAGSGTTNHVARKLGRHSIGIELNPAYADLAAQRMAQLSLLA